MSADTPKFKDGPIRFAVVGLGHIAQAAVLPAFENAENAVLTALVSRDDEKREKLGERYGVEHLYHYSDYDELLARDIVDAVYIALPNHLHCDYTVRAARAGVHVLCEKPMAVTEDECRKMIDVCDENGVHLMIAYRLHFEAANLEAIEAARRGDLGELRYFVSAFSQDVKGEDIRLFPLEKGGGTVYDMGVYCINAARYLFGAEPVEVVAFSESKEGDERFEDCDEMTTAILRFPENRIATFTSSFGAADISTYQLVGTKGELRMDPAYRYATNLRYEIESEGESREKTFPKRDQFGPQLVYFSNCIIQDERPEPDGYEGLADVRIVQAVYESAETGRPIMLESVKQPKRPDISQKITRPGFEKPEEIKASSPKEDG
ncbi:MAG: Gfo/Idh/MocA family protein [Bradymonadaceae bacterium]